jgi:hypothetical protein
VGEAQMKEIEEHFLKVIKNSLISGEEIVIKNYFTIKRRKSKIEGDKYCSTHKDAVEKYKKANKGKGITAYANSPVWRKLMVETKKCAKCQAKKKSRKEIKPTAKQGISFSLSKGFFGTDNAKKAKLRAK